VYLKLVFVIASMQLEGHPCCKKSCFNQFASKTEIESTIEVVLVLVVLVTAAGNVPLSLTFGCIGLYL